MIQKIFSHTKKTISPSQQPSFYASPHPLVKVGRLRKCSSDLRPPEHIASNPAHVGRGTDCRSKWPFAFIGWFTAMRLTEVRMLALISLLQGECHLCQVCLLHFCGPQTVSEYFLKQNTFCLSRLTTSRLSGYVSQAMPSCNSGWLDKRKS